MQCTDQGDRLFEEIVIKFGKEKHPKGFRKE